MYSVICVITYRQGWLEVCVFFVWFRGECGGASSEFLGGMDHTLIPPLELRPCCT